MALYHLGERVNPYIARLEREGFEVVRNPVGRCLTEDELVRILPGVFATVAGVEPYTERVFRAAPDLRIVARYGVGYDKVDVAAATRRGVAVAMAFGTNHEAVADSALTLMAAVVGNVVRHHLRGESGRVGHGHSPRSLARHGGDRGAGADRQGRSPALPGLRDAHPGVRRRSRCRLRARERHHASCRWTTLLREADIVTLHAPAHAGDRKFDQPRAAGAR